MCGVLNRVAVNLEALNTDQDLVYLHWWNWETNIEEVMHGLHSPLSSKAKSSTWYEASL